MEFPSILTQAVLLKRYKRFLAEIVLNNQEHHIIYCPNMGSMSGCDILGSRVWFSHSENPRRRFPDTWELVEVNSGYLVSVNSQYSNALIKEAIENGTIQELSGYTSITLDPPSMDENGFDILLEQDFEEGALAEQAHISSKCFIVSKSVTLGDEIHRGFFPDSPTERGCQQLKSLIHAKQLGYRSVLLYSVLHTGIDRLFPADHIDSEYGKLLRQAMIAGVEIYGYRVDISLSQIQMTTPIEVCIPARLICGSRSEKSK